ncbi:brachyurin-like [Onthophagus taurus]|uniref:brachyurin-like n=1 Tax=Onthophagus taurus TaxID=166361 RepID=UPI0039BDD8A4
MKVLAGVLLLAVLAQAIDDDWRTITPRNVYPKIPIFEVPGGERIVGGYEAARNSIPYQAGLFITTPAGTFFCGGSLISPTTILTAAHCVDGASSVQVRLGAHSVSAVESTQVRITSERFTVHSGWDADTLFNDIALVHLPEAAPINENIQTIQLPSGDTSDFAGVSARVSGWGKDSDQAAGISPVLRYVFAPVITNSECSNTFGWYITSGHVCIRGTGGIGSCSGDSGGPLVVDGVQIGVVSFGAAAGCELGYPSAFTRVTSFLDWISSNSDVLIN